MQLFGMETYFSRRLEHRHQHDQAQPDIHFPSPAWPLFFPWYRNEPFSTRSQTERFRDLWIFFFFLTEWNTLNIKGSVGLIDNDCSESIGHADFYTARSVISAVYTSPAFHEVQTCCTTLSSFPRIYSSAICLSGTCGVFFIEAL
jgi:hypothetical protein